MAPLGHKVFVITDLNQFCKYYHILYIKVKIIILIEIITQSFNLSVIVFDRFADKFMNGC